MRTIHIKMVFVSHCRNQCNKLNLFTKTDRSINLIVLLFHTAYINTYLCGTGEYLWCAARLLLRNTSGHASHDCAWLCRMAYGKNRMSYTCMAYIFGVRESRTHRHISLSVVRYVLWFIVWAYDTNDGINCVNYRYTGIDAGIDIVSS